MPLKNLEVTEPSQNTNIFPTWHEDIYNFFSKFEDSFAEATRIYTKHFFTFNRISGGEPSSEQQLELDQFFPKVWKRNGDDIIYSVEVKDSYHLVYCVIMFLTTIYLYREKSNVYTQDHRKNDIKSMIWVAGFPLINSEISFESHPERVNYRANCPPAIANLIDLLKFESNQLSDKKLDFVGPSMDIGFRLGTIASHTKIPLSAELVYIMTEVFSQVENKNFLELENFIKVNEEISKYKFLFNIFYDGEATLKGVFDNRGYPFFWIKSPYKETAQIHADKFFKNNINLSDLNKYFRGYFDARGYFLLRPILEDCDLLPAPGKEYTSYLNEWKKHLMYKIETDESFKRHRYLNQRTVLTPEDEKNASIHIQKARELAIKNTLVRRTGD